MPKSKSLKRKLSKTRYKHGGMPNGQSAAQPILPPLTFTAMDAAAATADQDELEAIRLTKNIFSNKNSISFKQSHDVDYLLVDCAWDTYDQIWELIRLIETPLTRAALAIRDRSSILASSAELYGRPAPPIPFIQIPSSIPPKERMRVLGARARAMIMDQLTHGPHGPSEISARKLTNSLTQHIASQANINHNMSIEASALRTIEAIKDIGWKKRMVNHMMFPVDIRPLVPKSILMSYHPLAQFVASYVKKPLSQIGNTYSELQRTALQKLCDTLMPIDVLVAIATTIEYHDSQPHGDYIPARDH
jgi:hypothetical protein